MKILFNTCFGAFFQKGGGEVQLLRSKEALEELGHSVMLYDHWGPQLDFDVFHQFSIEPGVEQVVRKYREMNKKIALSTIMWNLPPKDHHEFHRIKSILLMSDILFTNSEIESKRLSDWYEINPNKFHSTRNSISKSYLNAGDAKIFRTKYEAAEPFILSVANIDTRKNTHSLVQACKELNFKLVTIGHVKDSKYFDTFKDSYVGYTHLGPIEDETMLRSAYNACTLFALPSFCETPGIVALEAASQGAKVVITNEGSAEEYLLNFATYVDPTSIDSIKGGLQTEMNQNRDRTLISNHITRNYTWKRTAEEILEGYRRI